MVCSLTIYRRNRCSHGEFYLGIKFMYTILSCQAMDISEAQTPREQFPWKFHLANASLLT